MNKVIRLGMILKGNERSDEESYERRVSYINCLEKDLKKLKRKIIIPNH
jgi:hypothetical protein